ncbi:MAG: nuclear transport factor 2 family protein [Bacillota bacterium]|nr:nuclear transport factor 2 family protein [Bacillota bacterium]
MHQQNIPNDEDKLVREPLTVDSVYSLWSKTYNTQGEPDWSHLFPYYDSQIVFQDTIQRIEGKEAFNAMCQRLAKRCQSLNMELLNVLKQDKIIMIEWIMTMSFTKYPSTPLYGSTRLTLNDQGLIIEQRDYYDLWGDIFNNIPRFNKIYRKFLSKKFG